ncbi:hypothetical protein GCM10011408_24170 [Dyella caseinilytica]|nr:hypothetical protein GCM10011408_24170 [Dyella caseinilytica]
MASSELGTRRAEMSLIAISAQKGTASANRSVGIIEVPFVTGQAQ